MPGSRKPSIITLPPTVMGLVGVLSLGIMAAAWIFGEYTNFERERAEIRESYLEEQKKFLFTTVSQVVSFVEFNRGRTEQKVRQTLRDKVDEATTVATHIIDTFGPTRDPEELRRLVREALRPIRFNDGRGYFFAFDLNGIEQLFADRPELEGTNMLGMQGAEGEYVVRDMLKIVRSEGEGFYRYTWTKPGQPADRQFAKIAFARLIEPLGWVIGTGEYLTDMEADIRKNVLDQISEMRVLGNEYVFAVQWDGLALAGPGAGRNMIDVTDVNGVEIVRELIAAAKRGGGFVEYVLPDFGSGRTGRKISYAAPIPDWQWYVGVGTFVDAIEDRIAASESQFRQRLVKKLALVVALAALAAVAVFGTMQWLYRKTTYSMQMLLSLFRQDGEGPLRIDTGNLPFREFAVIADEANQMVSRQTQRLREAKDAADSASRAKTEFLAGVSHEFRTPLNAIIGFSDMMRNRVLGPLGNRTYEEYASDIHDSGQHLLHLINDILDLSKIEARALELERGPIDLKDVADSAVRLIRPGAEGKGLTVTNEVAPGLPPVIGDERRVRQMLINLLSNAAKFTGPGGRIVLRAEVGDEGAVVLSVSDSGIGMTPQEVDVALSPFGQVNSRLARNEDGTGLGLPLTKTLIALHGGSMTVDSAKGEGTTVSLRFPSGRPPDDEPASPA